MPFSLEKQETIKEFFEKDLVRAYNNYQNCKKKKDNVLMAIAKEHIDACIFYLILFTNDYELCYSLNRKEVN